jgi:radical SAM superfamily enzyme YgiQ (UPF0313 family)
MIHSEDKVLLVMLPFWTPLIPPMGISCLKSYLQPRGFNVKTADANTETQFRELYDRYFDVLREYVPEDKQGNFYSIGQDVLHNHMMARLNYTLEKNYMDYIELVELLIAKTFFCRVDPTALFELNRIVAEFFLTLENYVIRLLETENPAVLGLSVCSGTLAPSLFAFGTAREWNPRLTTVMGGGIFCDQFALGTPNFQRLLESTRGTIDKFIIGEGEILFYKFLKGELPESKRYYSFADISGENVELAAVDVPDFSDFDTHQYPYLSNYTSRSCPFQCNFCSDNVMWGKYRKKKSHQIVQELTRLSETWGNRLFMMSDLLLNPVVSDLAEAFEQSEASIYWDGCLRAEKHVCDIENTLKWRRGGLYRARIGCESGSPRVLELMSKKTSVDRIKAAVSTLAAAGIQTTTYWVIGFPGETEEDFQQTLDLIEELKDDIYEAECRPFYYYLTGQAGSDFFAKERKSIPLYPAAAEKMLVFQTWLLDGEPSRKETYRRVNRFVDHCKKNGIPNPYSLKDIYDADMRWKNLHRNAVPSMAEIKKNSVPLDECKHVEKMLVIQQHAAVNDEGGDFNF